jgi:hypothetical protein
MPYNIQHYLDRDIAQSHKDLKTLAGELTSTVMGTYLLNISDRNSNTIFLKLRLISEVLISQVQTSKAGFDNFGILRAHFLGEFSCG